MRSQKHIQRQKQRRKEKKKLLRREEAQRKAAGEIVYIDRDDLGPGAPEKMSEVLMEFLEPHVEKCKTAEEIRKLVLLGIVAWNAAVAPPAEGERLIRDTMGTMPPDVRKDYLSVIADLMERKLAFFADNTRLIVDYELTMGPDGPHLSVASTLG